MKATEFNALIISNGKDKLLPEDVGKLFWRVEYRGALIQYRILDVFESGKGKFECASLTTISNYEYKLRDNIEYFSTQEFGMDIINGPRYYTNFEEAKAASKAKFYEQVNPHADYRVVKIFDDVREGWVTGPLPKKEAAHRASELNKSNNRYLTRYDIVVAGSELDV